jgi:hypothetical protein
LHRHFVDQIHEVGWVFGVPSPHEIHVAQRFAAFDHQVFSVVHVDDPVARYGRAALFDVVVHESAIVAAYC